MGLARSLRSVVGQFGVGRDDYDDYDDVVFAGPQESDSGAEAPLSGRGGSVGFDAIYRDEPLRHSPQSRERAAKPLAIVRPLRVEFSLFAPQDFDDAQQIADRLRAGGPVIVDLQSCARDLAERLIDFCSGLSYAVDGRMDYVGDKVVLLVPHNVELSSDALGGLQERRFFNQV